MKVVVGFISVLKYLFYCILNLIMVDKFEKKINIYMYGYDRSNYYYYVYWKKFRIVYFFLFIVRLKKYWFYYRLIFFCSFVCLIN